MNGITVAVIGGALLIATAAGVAIWWTKKNAAKSTPMPAQTPAPAPAPVVTYQPAPAPAPRPAPAPNIFNQVGNVATGIAGAVKTVTNVVNTVSNLFKGFKLF